MILATGGLAPGRVRYGPQGEAVLLRYGDEDQGCRLSEKESVQRGNRKDTLAQLPPIRRMGDQNRARHDRDGGGGRAARRVQGGYSRDIVQQGLAQG